MLEIKNGLKNTVKIKFDFSSRNLSSLLAMKKEYKNKPLENGIGSGNGTGGEGGDLGSNLESVCYIPEYLRLSPSYLSSGVWALLQSTDKKDLKVVVIFKLCDGGSYCDVRDVHGVLERKVKTSRVFQIPWGPGNERGM